MEGICDLYSLKITKVMLEQEPYLFFASQDALEVMFVTESVSNGGVMEKHFAKIKKY